MVQRTDRCSRNDYSAKQKVECSPTKCKENLSKGRVPPLKVDPTLVDTMTTWLSSLLVSIPNHHQRYFPLQVRKYIELYRLYHDAIDGPKLSEKTFSKYRKIHFDDKGVKLAPEGLAWCSTCCSLNAKLFEIRKVLGRENLIEATRTKYNRNKEKFEKEFKAHMKLVDEERSYYENRRNEAKQRVANGSKELSLAFDFKTPTEIPRLANSPQNLTLSNKRICNYFGIIDELTGDTFIGLFDSTFSGESWPHVVYILFDYILNRMSVDEVQCYDLIALQTDNCANENTNRYICGMCAMFIALGYAKRVTLNTLVVGHTKFCCDRVFGIISNVNRNSSIYSLSDQERINNIRNIRGKIYNSFVDYRTFFTLYFKKVGGISKWHHIELEKFNEYIHLRGKEKTSVPFGNRRKFQKVRTEKLISEFQSVKGLIVREGPSQPLLSKLNQIKVQFVPREKWETFEKEIEDWENGATINEVNDTVDLNREDLFMTPTGLVFLPKNGNQTFEFQV